MNRKVWWILAAFLIAAGAGVAARVFLFPPAEAPAEDAAGDQSTATAVAITEELVLEPADLYFPSVQGGLRVHQQALPAGEPLDRIRSLVGTLLEGPGGAVDGDLYRPLPEGTVLQRVYFMKSGAVALDLRSRSTEAPIEALDSPEASTEQSEEPAPVAATEPVRLSLGSEDELLAVYSLVNTVALNGIEGVERIVLLWDGRQPETFAGHIDVSRPLLPDTSWVMKP